MSSYLNLGCGNRYHPAWINIDVAPQGSEVIQHDLSQGIPLADASCSVVYHAAMLEHLRRADALFLLQECHRVLQPGGIIRVGVPDLERLCRLYLHTLQAAQSGDEAAAHDYDWIMLELYDQTVREQNGGEMLTYLRQEPLPNQPFVFARIGEEGRELVQAIRQQTRSNTQESTPAIGPLLDRLRGRFVSIPAAVRQRLMRLLLGQEGIQALTIGRFRQAGEVHQWMYDQYSLARLLQAVGFRDPIVQSAVSSLIPDWNVYHLDTLPDGTVIKPDLFFMEATKPE